MMVVASVDTLSSDRNQIHSYYHKAKETNYQSVWLRGIQAQLLALLLCPS